MKANAQKIGDGVYWIGVLDWDLRSYHGYTLDGTTYNAYIVFGEDHVAVIDNAYPGKTQEMMARIEDAFAQEGRDEVVVDYIIQNHVEKDHSGVLVDLHKRFPEAPIYCSEIAVKGLLKHYPALEGAEFVTVGTGDTLEMDGRTFAFLDAFLLHWPDSMFTLLVEDGILFPNDAFGQHICFSERFSDEVEETILLNNAQKFYANLVVNSSLMYNNKMKELADLDLVSKVKMIAPSHGQIFKDPSLIINKYNEWANGVCKDKVTLIYDTMHHSTQKMAASIAEGIMSEGFEVKMYFLHEDDRSDVVTDVLDSKAICLGAPTIMNKPYPSVGDIIYYLDALNFKATGYTKKAVVFGSKGWGGGANKKMSAELEAAGFDVVDQFDTIFIPDDDVLDQCYDLGKKLAQSLKDE